jgi:type IV secretory pathway TrbL component
MTSIFRSLILLILRGGLLPYTENYMNRKTASLSFLAVCVLLAILLLTSVITPIISGLIFAVALVALGIVSKGFTRNREKDQTNAA